MHLQENTLFDLDLEVRVAQNVAQYHLHHVASSPARFEIASSNRLEGGCIYKKIHYSTFDFGVKVT